MNSMGMGDLTGGVSYYKYTINYLPTSLQPPIAMILHTYLPTKKKRVKSGTYYKLGSS
jgi:hypothetical protein